MKTADHNGKTCYFSEKDHRYFVGDQTLLSATQFKGSFFPEFEKERVAKAYAKKHGLTVEAVLADWEERGRIGRERGTLIHDYAESQFILPGAVQVPECWANLKNAVDIAVARLSERYEFLRAEMIVFSTALGLAGQIDLLMRDSETGDILIWDWKTDKAIEQDNPWRKAYPPIDHLADCNFNEYGIQLNIYERIMKEERHFPPGTKFRRGLIHLTDAGPKWHRIPDMQGEVERMLEWI
jgi:hypothetical protein